MPHRTRKWHSKEASDKSKEAGGFEGTRGSHAKTLRETLEDEPGKTEDEKVLNGTCEAIQ